MNKNNPKTKKEPKNKSRINRLYLFSFLLPVFIMFVIFICRKIYPFGDRSFLHIDMYHQYFPFLVEFYHKLKDGENLFYSWNTGIGSNFLALYVYYLATPFNWLAVLCPEDLLMEFISYLVILKIGLCGLSFSFYISKHFKTNSMTIICFSVFYALSGYMAAYNWNVMWLDCIVLAPLIILGLEQLVHEGKCKLYCITLFLSIFSNYYISIMICIFLVLYFAVLLIARERSAPDSAAIPFPKLDKIKNFYGKATLRFTVYSLLAGGMAGILLLPEIAALKFTEFSAINFPSKIKSYFSVIDMLARHCFDVTVETGLDHWPNIFCGVAVFLLLPLYVMQKNAPLKEKVAKLCLLAFMLISFSTNILNFIWHGLNYPDSLPARQSFLYILLLLTVCFEAFLHIREHSRNEIMGVFLGVLFFILLCEKLITDDSFTAASFLFTGILLICYGIILHLYRTSSKISGALAIFTLIIVILEAGINTYVTSCPTVSRTSYLSNYDSYKTLTARTMSNDPDFYRFEKFSRRTQNDAMLIGFPSASYFSSTSNALVKDFYENYGMKSSRVYYCYDGATPLISSLLSVKYMLSTTKRPDTPLYSLADREGNLYLYENTYSLPLGYMVSTDIVSPSDMESITAHHNAMNSEASVNTSDASSAEDAFNELFSSAEDAEENLHSEEEKTYEDTLNPISRQNLLASRLNIDSPLFVPIEVTQNEDNASIIAATSGHIYAYTRNTKIDTINLSCAGETAKFKTIKKKYILDLGYYEAGSVISLSSENGESLNISAYRLEETALAALVDSLTQQTMTVDSYDETHIKGHIQVTTPGQLVLSVPYEPGWTLKVDGVNATIDLFEDTMMSVYLPEGEHTIELSYYPDGLNPGIIVSIISVLLFAVICYVTKRYKKA